MEWKEKLRQIVLSGAGVQERRSLLNFSVSVCMSYKGDNLMYMRTYKEPPYTRRKISDAHRKKKL